MSLSKIEFLALRLACGVLRAGETGLSEWAAPVGVTTVVREVRCWNESNDKGPAENNRREYTEYSVVLSDESKQY